MVTRELYKGNDILVLHRGENTDRYPFSFGLAKAKLIVENIEAIKAFVAEQEAKLDAAKN